MTDVISWADSDPYEEDDSWSSEHESVCNNWRGWKKAATSAGNANNLNNGVVGGNGAGIGGLGAGPSGVAGPSAGPSRAGPLNNNTSMNTWRNVPSTSRGGVMYSASDLGSGSGLLRNALSASTGPGTSPSTSAAVHPLVAINSHRPSSPTYDILNATLRGMSLFSFFDNFYLAKNLGLSGVEGRVQRASPSSGHAVRALHPAPSHQEYPYRTQRRGFDL